MEIKETMSFLDEDGNKVEFEIVAEIFLDEKKYLIMEPVGSTDDDAYIFRIDLEEEKEVLNLVDNDEEFIKVKKEYKNLLYSK